MTSERFDHLLSLVKEQTERKDTHFRKIRRSVEFSIRSWSYRLEAYTQELCTITRKIFIVWCY